MIMMNVLLPELTTVLTDVGLVPSLTCQHIIKAKLNFSVRVLCLIFGSAGYCRINVNFTCVYFNVQILFTFIFRAPTIYTTHFKSTFLLEHFKKYSL